MNPSAEHRFLFIHVMKTGGTSFADLLRSNFSRTERYPDVVLSPESDLARRIEAYTHVPRLVADANAHADQLRIVRGHIPYSVRLLLQAEFMTMTILRHPLERTLSYLKHCRMYHPEHQDMSLEEIYDQPWFFETFMHNYQTKIFSMTPEEALAENRFGDTSPPLPPRGALAAGQALPEGAARLLRTSPARLTLELFSPSTGVIDVDERRLETARQNLEQITLLGITERYGSFLEALNRRYGWKVDRIPHRNTGVAADIPAQLRVRIERDNRLDMDLYEHARSLAV